MSYEGQEDIAEHLKCKFDHNTFDYILESKDAMASLLIYIDEQPKAVGLNQYIEGWLCTKDGTRFEQETLDKMWQNLPERDYETDDYDMKEEGDK